MNLKDYVTNIVDFPKKGIIFRDVTTILQNGEAFKYAVEQLAKIAKEKGANVIVGPEARGFMFGCPVAVMNNCGFVPVRKPGKLPREVIEEEYSLEYGTNTLAIHKDAIKKGDKVFIIDDLLATGGTALAASRLVERLGGEVVGLGFVIDLVDLKGREVLKGYDVSTLIEFEGE